MLYEPLIEAALRNMNLRQPNYFKWFNSSRNESYQSKFIMAILALIEPKYTLELGSGLSTAVFSESVGIMHYAYVHKHRQWALTIDNISRLCSIDTCTVFLRPLDGDHMYRILPGDVPEERIQVVLINGPPLMKPLEGQERSRVNTLPSILHLLSRDAVVLLSNAERDSEKDCLQRWSEDLGIDYSISEEVSVAVVDPWASCR